jgi:hypothetical protein
MKVIPRLIVIDDTDPSIQYSGPWFEVNNAQVDTGINGPPFQNTLHGVNVTASFSFNFSGSIRKFGKTLSSIVSSRNAL